MKPDRLRWWLFVLLLGAYSQALPQAITAANDGNGGANISETAHGTVATPEPATDPQASHPASQTPANSEERPYGWHTAIYPALAWVPIFGTSVTLPPLPSQPIAPGQSGSTSGSFNGAYFGGARFEKGKWSADALFMWAALSGERTTPHTSVDLDFIFGDAHVGREVFPNLYLEGGFRRLNLDIHATVNTDSASGSPGYWDPLIGLTYRRQLGKKWRVLIHGDGGGFGVGSDVDVSGTGRAEWQFARHFGLTMGYGGMHFSDSTTVSGGKLTISPTMHGPIFGFGLYF
jgi:hypothetical protein